MTLSQISSRFRSSRRLSRKSALKATLLATGVTAGAAAALGARALSRRRLNRFDLAGKVVVITGGSRGLGLALADECTRLGAAVSICARDERELQWAKETLERTHDREVITHVCDVTVNDEVHNFISSVVEHYGRIDVLINNAGVISVGPSESQTLTDYQEAMDTMYWGIVYSTLAALPHMRAQRAGRIANITSIGGKISVPHLLPYSAAKFAAVGFSEGMRAELAKDGVKVTTICPGLMRTGSHLNAYFKGQHRKEFSWFALGASLPLVSIEARRAARKIIDAVRVGDAELVITPQAKLAALVHGIFPGLTSDILGIANRFMPAANANHRNRHLGRDSETALTRSILTKSGRTAAKELHQQQVV